MEAETTTTKPLKTQPKISVKIWRPIIDKLDAKLDAACLRRDAFLARLLAGELDLLDSEVSLPNSPAAHDFTFERLDALDRKLVSIALAPQLARRLHDICTRKAIVRDAFFNRLFLLLATQPKIIDTLFFPDEPKWRTAVWSQFKHDEPFFESGFYPLEAPVDPFWAIRAGLDLFNEGAGAEDFELPGTGTRIKVVRAMGGEPEPLPGLYNIFFEQKVGANDLLGLNCFVPDWRIPGHEAERRRTTALDDLLESLK